MAKKTRSLTKAEQRKLMEPIYPDAVAFLEGALGNKQNGFKSTIVDGSGKRITVTTRQKLEISKLIVDQVAGKAPTTISVGGDPDAPPITSVEVHHSYDNDNDKTIKADEDLIPVEDPLKTPKVNSNDPDAVREAEWLAGIEQEATGS
jgi:hypothetical protein